MDAPTASARPDAGPIGFTDHLTAAIGVSDFARSLRWYTDVLGLEVIYTLDDWGWAELRSNVAGANIGIGQEETVHPKGGATVTFGVTDIAAARAWLEAHDTRFDGETREIEGMVRLATFYDPDGNALMLAQRLAGMADRAG
jgi:catechol 2,3-dioxygenase-like lactoylglutathione lyase family enzyme